MVAGEEGSSEGMVTIELLCDDVGYPNTSPGLA
jgi:hypothetical protein